MSLGRFFAWAIVLFAALVPFNWMRLAAQDGLPNGQNWHDLVNPTFICWSIAGALGFFLVMSARGAKLRQAESEQASRQKQDELRQLLSAPLSEVKPSKALLKHGEKAFATVIANLEEIKTVGYSAGSAGVSVRVAKGVTIRSGGMKGGAIKELVSVASGELVITDKRVIFAGDLKSFAISLDDLISTTNFSDGFGFSDNKSTYTLITHNENDRMRFAVVIEKLLRDSSDQN